ncbi:alcohol dehydrogenase catalytic domain-containing protein [uncultured Acetatifactor sp.]|jgi:threonine dehydrogenase-like Zn-dependent dehydrogenase|uniref:alcohol dehydrogenase catalytic domain-containing protein n=1 Tax=uncultured Acetatifactor sp. TaxID=1671927 RepID=UPI002617420A|nr:alcohol dehydrogenase catalytic domain-containing protein [uncultured Acetatifactor sp.]
MNGTLPKTMKALVAYDKGDYRFEAQYPVPECGDDEIVIKTEGCGICAGDLKCYHGNSTWGDETHAKWVRPPFIPGHEFLGHVAARGKNVTAYEIGDRVIADQIIPCGECRFCRTGRYWMCEPHAIFGFQKENNGGMAEYVRFPKNAVVHRVPEEMTLEQALMIEPYSCSKHAVDRADISIEDVVVISGAGTLGLGMITYARQMNPARLIALDMMDERLQKAKEFGADIVINPGKEDALQIIRDMTEGYGCDIYIEATGHPSSVVQGLQMVRRLGRFVEFGVFAQQTTVDWTLIGDNKELDVLGSHLSPYCYPYVIENIANGKLKTEGIVKTFFRLEEWEKAFDYATGKYGDFKIAFRFD